MKKNQECLQRAVSSIKIKKELWETTGAASCIGLSRASIKINCKSPHLNPNHIAPLKQRLYIYIKKKKMGKHEIPELTRNPREENTYINNGTRCLRQSR